MKKNFLLRLMFLLLCFSPSLVYGVDTAKRISDREIIESLAELKAELKAGQQIALLRFEQIDKRFEQMDKRFEQMDKRFEQMDKRFEQRFNQLEQNLNTRMNYQENLTMILISSILGLVAFIIWDRKTALRPLEKKLDKLEQDLQHDLELQSPEGSRLTRLIHTMREMAKSDLKIAKTLKTFSLL